MCIQMESDEDRFMSEFYEARVEDIMDIRVWDLPLIEQDESVTLVLSILDGKTHVWVVEDTDSKQLVGVITRHDILHILAPSSSRDSLFSVPDVHRDPEGTAADIMTSHPITCRPDESVADALTKMIRHNIRRLAVVEDHTITGELTLRNLISKYYKATQYHPLAEE